MQEEKGIPKTNIRRTGMISRILVPTDGSETSRKAASYAVDLAKLTRASIIAVTVIDRSAFIGRPLIPDSATPVHIVEPVEDYLKELAQKDLDEIEQLCGREGIESRLLILYGHPVEQIVQEAERSAADLIVIGSQGRSALGAALLGSTTFGVIHHDTKTPVLVVRK
jgi:nucleotide-binding universal stress UspA family protein